MKTERIIIFLLAISGTMQSDNANAQTWGLTGNAGTNPAVNFAGTTDNKNFKIRTNNQVRINVTGNGKVGIGNFTPVFRLDIKGGSINTDSLYRISGVKVLSRNNSNQIQIGEGGAKVGIGTTTPVTALEVNGVITATGGSSTNWNSAFNWGNHATAGYLASGALTAGYVPRWNGTQLTDGGIRDDNGNVAIGAVPISGVKLTVNGGANIAKFSGTTGMFLSLFENNVYRGYLGSYSGAGSDVDFGTGNGNTSGSVHLAVQSVPGLTLNSDAKVGIGTTNPSAKLQVNYASTGFDPQLRLHQLNADFARINFTNSTTSNHWAIGGMSAGANSQARLNFYNSVSGNVLSLTGDGNVCIGTTTPATGYKLSVHGKIIAEELKVMLHANWPDYVFDESYNLMPLEELKIHLQNHRHLPGIPSAGEIEMSQGYEIGAMQQKLLEKVEELTLYVIKQQDEINALKKSLTSGK